MSDTPLTRIPFTKDDEKTILSMSGAMRIAAIANVVAAAAAGISGLLAANPGGFLGLLFQVVFAILLLKAAKHFEAVAKTDDDDQRNIAQGIEQLRSLFLIKAILVILGLTLFAVVMFAMLLLAAAR